MQAVSQETGQDLDPSNQSGGEGPRGPQQEGAPEQGAILASKVHTIKPFGVFVQMQGWRTNGLVHVRQVLALMLLLPAWLLAAHIAGSLGLANRSQGTKPTHSSAPSCSGCHRWGWYKAQAGCMSGAPVWAAHAAHALTLHRYKHTCLWPIPGHTCNIQLLVRACRAAVRVQVSNFMDFGKDDSDEEKVAALRSVVAEGDPCFVKVLDVRLDEASGTAVGFWHHALTLILPELLLVEQASLAHGPALLEVRARSRPGDPGLQLLLLRGA